MSSPTEVTCSWEECPTHETIHPARALTLHWPKAAETLKYFHSTDCLAAWAASFPEGYLITGENASGVWNG